LNLLNEAGVPLTARDWRRVVVLRSSGSPVHPFRAVDRHLSDRGFHFLILSERGDITHYCKCRPLWPQGRPHRETQVLQAFADDHDARQYVPEFAAVRDDRVDVQIARYVQGEVLNRTFMGMSTEARLELVDDAMIPGASLCTAAMLRPDIFGHCPGEVPLSDLAESFLGGLSSLDIDPKMSGVLRNAFREAGTVPLIPQHGDYWPENVLRTREAGWCVLDLDNFGDIAVPLYDVLHMLRTSEDAVPGPPRGPWITLIASDAPGPVAARRIIRRESASLELAPDAVAGCILFYLMHIGLHIRSRGAPVSVWGRFRDEVPAACALLEHSGSLRRFAEFCLAD